MPVTPSPTPATCPSCGQSMRQELDGVRRPPMPKIFWFCANIDCKEGKSNKIFHGG